MKNKLLIIDSEPFDREVMAKIFSGTYELSYAVTVADCFSSCQEFLPDVVYFELRKPEMEQLETVCESLQKYRPGIPFIVSATENTLELERFARVNRVFYYMIRPFNLRELWDSMASAFYQVGYREAKRKQFYNYKAS